MVSCMDYSNLESCSPKLSNSELHVKNPTLIQKKVKKKISNITMAKGNNAHKKEVKKPKKEGLKSTQKGASTKKT